ncbi:MAG: tetratricopeptide repeat protein [Ignavibacteria bacterium]|jgi:outer membrane protein assembly factor BamD (BamD/ComL family)|nr:tetratricopeptide repeat protein [Ignavibacteria bacterium]MDH7527049.1 tetratricopeptide repeat protein [Ignavibacteria bacterium]
MNRLKSFLPIFLLSLFFSSCAVTDFLKKGFENFTTYFNIYYNANKIFSEAEEELLKQQKDIFTTKVITPSGNVTNKLVQVIEKCSKILQYHQNSSLVDDALFMIGKAYYYQREYPSAIRKFSELLATFPDSKYALEAKLWIARSYAQTIETDRALKLLNEIYLEAKDQEEEEVMSLALLEIIKIYFKRNDYESIINFGQEFVKISDDDEAIAQVLMQIGNSYAKLGQLDQALENYSKVKKYTSDYYYIFKSQLEFAKILREKNRIDEAKKILKDLYSESLFDEYKDYIELEYAYLYLSEKDTAKALDYFVKVDTTYQTRETAGIAQYEIANYLENVVGIFDSAKYYYDKSLRSQLPDNLKKSAQIKSNILNRYKNLWTSIRNLEKQIPILRTFPVDTTYPKFQEIEIDSSMLNDSAYLADLQEYLAEKKRADSLYAEKLKRDSLTYQANLKTADSLEVNIARLKFDLATLFMIDYEKPDSAYVHLKSIVEKYPDKDFSERAIYALASYYEIKGEKEKADSLYQYIYENFIDTEISKIAAKKLKLPIKVGSKDLPDLKYREAENLVEQKKYKEAINKLQEIYNEHEKTDYAPKSLLMIGYIYENKLSQFDSAYSVYKQLKEKFPQSLYTQRINSKLIAYESELQRREMERKAIQDSIENSNKKPESKPDENQILENDEKKENPELKIEEQIKPDSTIRKEQENNRIRRK